MALPAAAAAPAAGAPAVSITTPSDNAYVGSNVTVTWEVAGGEDVIYYEVWWDDELVNVGQNQSLELTGLAEGRHVVTVRAHCLSGSADDSVVFFVDVSDPQLVILSPAPGEALNVSDATVRWQADDPSLIAFFEVRLDGSTEVLRLGRSATEHTFLGLPDGDHTVLVRAVDGAGNSTSRTVRFSVDTAVPWLHLTAPADGSVSISGGATVTWEAGDEPNNLWKFDILLDGIPLPALADVVRSFAFTNLPDGEHVVEVRAVDRANNTAWDRVAFTVDTVPPEVVSTFPGDGAAIGTAISVAFSKPMDRQNSTVAVEGVAGTVSWDGSTATFTPSAPLTYGTTYNVTVAARDHLGRWANVSWSFTTTDLARLTGTVLDTSGNPLVNATVSIVGGPSVLTGPDGTFRLEFHAGEHILSVTHPGFVARNMPVSIDPGEERSLGEVRLSSSDILPLLGWVAALVGIGLVALLYSLSRSRRRRPPVRGARGKAASRSWKGLEELEKRARRDRDPGEDLDDRGRL